MKRLIWIFLGIFLIGLIISFMAKPVVLSIAKKQIRQVFKDSTVLVGNCSIEPLQVIKLYDIEIKNEPVYSFKVKEFKIYYNLVSLFKGTLPWLSFKGVEAKINMPHKKIAEFSRYLNLKSSKTLLINNIALSGVGLDLKTSDILLKGRVSLELNLIQPRINSLDCDIETFDLQDFHLGDSYLQVSQDYPGGKLYIGEVKYNKIKIKELKARVKLEGKIFLFNALAGQLLEGELQGDLGLIIDKNPEYIIRLNVLNIDLASLARDFNLTEKVEISGKLGGGIKLTGRGMSLGSLDGDFSTDAPGGVLTIKDTQILDTMVQRTEQPVEVLVASFKDYQYNKGRARLYSDDNNLILDVALEGETGKRNFNITMHGFKLKKEVP